MIKVAILGAGKIGSAVYQIISNLKHSTNVEYDDNPYAAIDAFVIDADMQGISLLPVGRHVLLDFSSCTDDDLVKLLVDSHVTHVINALPFFLNRKVGNASKLAGCHYIDFTEDDKSADDVKHIYENSDLNCAVKCGLAPGFINYIGYNLIKHIDVPDTLMISVGALPRSVSFDVERPELSYNLTWSIDGLVNEYINPCRVRLHGLEAIVKPLGGYSKVVLDGVEYEAAYTSGGIGSLVKDLVNVPNVYYKTLRYPGHYSYVRYIVGEHSNDFDKIRKTFSEKFPSTNDDVIVVYANALGKTKHGAPIRRSYHNKFYGTANLSGIQSTTAGSGVAILELMLTEKIKGTLSHSDISLVSFINTTAFKAYYNTIPNSNIQFL